LIDGAANFARSESTRSESTRSELREKFGGANRLPP